MTLYKFAKLVGGEDLITIHYPNGETETLEGCILLHAITYDDPSNLSLEVMEFDRHVNDYGTEVIDVWTERANHHLPWLKDALGYEDKPTIEEACILLGVCDRFNLEIEDHFNSITVGQINEVAKLSGRTAEDVFRFIVDNGIGKEV